MDYGVLINAVEGQKCLYDKCNAHYKNIVAKDVAWQEVANLTGMSKEDCKKRWNLLRERFNKEQKKRDLPSGSGASYSEEEWPYFESMTFLKKFIKPRKTKSNHFSDDSSEIEFETQSERSDAETKPKKSRKIDPFTDTCVVFKEAIEKFFNNENMVHQPKQDDPDDLFLQTIKGLIKDLPEYVKGQARIDILSYVTNLRNEHLGS